MKIINVFGDLDLEREREERERRLKMLFYKEYYNLK